MDPQTPEQDPSLKQIRTFQGDIADALARQEESLVSIQQTQQAKYRKEGIAEIDKDAELVKRRKDFIFLAAGSIFFIALGGLGAWYGYQQYVIKNAPPVILAPDNRFVSAESATTVSTVGKTREEVLMSFNDALSDLPAGKLRHIVLRSGDTASAPLVTSADFLKLMGSRAPGSLIRSFSPLFMLGAIGASPDGSGASRFIIFKLASYENAFGGMLNWEKILAEDLAPVFATSKLLNGIGPTSVFKDVIVRNKDVRVLEVEEPSTSTSTPAVVRTALLYSFFDNDMLIITDKLETLETLIERLTREKLSR